MKRGIALLLALVLILAMAPAARAAAPELTAADVLPMTAEPDRLEPLAAVSSDNGYACWVVPVFETYGQAAVIGRTMYVHYRANTNGLGSSGGYVGIMIYEGTYDSLTDASEPVAAYADAVGNYSAFNLSYEWNTKGCRQGDYTALFFVADVEMNVVAASAADLYLSKTEIPLKSIDAYVYELDDTPDVMYTSLDSSGSSYSIGVLYEPYHTTVARSVDVHTGTYGTYTGSNKTDMAELLGFFPPFDLNELWDPCDVTVTYTGAGPFASGVSECKDIIRVVFKHENEVVHFDDNVTMVCMGGVYQIPIYGPEGTGEVTIINGNPYALEILDVRDGYITLRPLSQDRSELSICADGAWDRMEIWPHREHSWWGREQAPTCTEDGCTYKECYNCGMIKDKVIKPALGHNVAEPVVTAEPTATRDGAGTGHCSRCNQDVEVVIPRIFLDTKPGAFYSAPLDYCYANGIVSGMTENTFGPALELNRAQLVTMLYRNAGSPAVEGESPYADVPAGAYCTDAVIWAYENGVVSGYEDGTFRPLNSINRQEIVTMLYSYVGMLGKDSGERDDLSAFDDLDDLMLYALEPMQWAVANGVVQGTSSTTLSPRQSAIRAQAVTILYRVFVDILGA